MQNDSNTTCELKEQLSHIKHLYTIKEIKEMYSSGVYNAELLLQHALIQLLSYKID